jgi:2-oxoglutarate dehydrogenase E2 component (dihydrolipoamide succinyltransferase)
LADITMPQLGETVTEGTITRWLKQVGDPVAEDDVLFEVSTDKVDSEVPSPVSGYIAEILVPEGDTVDVGTKLAVISSDQPAAAAPAPQPEPAVPPARAEPVAERPAEPPSPAEPVGPGPVAERPAPPPRPEPAVAAERTAGGSPAGGGGTRPADDRPPSRPGEGAGSSKVLSPVVRRLIAEHGLDPSTIQGTGAGGRITRADVLALIDRQSAAGDGDGSATSPVSPAPVEAGEAELRRADAATIDREAPVPTAAPPAAPLPAAPAAPAVAGQRDTIVPFTNIRRRTAEHMVRSKHTSAHTVVVMEVDYSAVERAREAEKERFKSQEGFSLTYLPFISRAVIDAIGSWPNVNSSVGDDQLIVHNYINLGIAVDLNFEGLLVPVVHDAEGKRLRLIAREISALAARARAKRLTMDDISGGTFTITNAGPFGTLLTIPVINQPQVAILATDGVRKKPVVVELPDGGDGIAIHPIGNLVLSFDHRAFDGAYASAFMGRVKEILETRDWAAEL